jgi:hypothetical protein
MKKQESTLSSGEPGRGLSGDGAAERVSICLLSVNFPDFCLHSAEMNHRTTPWVIREVVIRTSDRETLEFDCRLAHWAQEALLVLTDRDIK